MLGHLGADMPICLSTLSHPVERLGLGFLFQTLVLLAHFWISDTGDVSWLGSAGVGPGLTAVVQFCAGPLDGGTGCGSGRSRVGELGVAGSGHVNAEILKLTLQSKNKKQRTILGLYEKWQLVVDRSYLLTLRARFLGSVFLGMTGLFLVLSSRWSFFINFFFVLILPAKSRISSISASSDSGSES